MLLPAERSCRPICKLLWMQIEKAARFFATLTGANRYAVLYRIGAAKKAETRARKIESFVAMLERGETLHGQRSKPNGVKQEPTTENAELQVAPSGLSEDPN